MDQELHIHPLAAFSMIDSYERKMGTMSSIGILLGNVTSARGMRVIEVRSSYPINYQSKDELDVTVNWPLADNWCELHKLTYPNDGIIGWFLAGKKLLPYSIIIHRHCLSSYSSSSIFTFLDLSFETDNIELKAFRMVSLSGEKIGDSLNIGNVFIPIRHSITQSTPENLVLSALSRMEKAPKRVPQFERAISSIENLSVNVRTVEDICRIVDQIIDYIGGVLSDKVETPDLDFGRDLLKFLSSIPVTTDGENYSQQMSGLVQDLLTVINLSECAQLQIGLSESISNLDPLNY